MGMQGYILERYNVMADAYTCRRLAEEGRREDMDIRIIGVMDTLVTDRAVLNGEEALSPRDFLINRYKWGKVKGAVAGLAARCYNAAEAFDLYVNKYEQVKRLRSAGFCIPPYCLGTAAIPYGRLVDRLGTPFVAKGLESSMGREVFLIDGEEGYRSLSSTFGQEKEWLYEAFIRSSYGRDIRFFSIRGTVVACMQRRSRNDFRANVALGAAVEPFKVTPEIEQIASDIYEQTGLDFLGIDLLFGESKPWFCEINVMPGLKGIEAASGVNVARQIILTIRGDFQ